MGAAVQVRVSPVERRKTDAHRGVCQSLCDRDFLVPGTVTMIHRI